MLLIGVLAISSSAPVSAQLYELSPLSQLQIEGTSSINAFTCFAEELRIKEGGTIGLRGADVQKNYVTIIVPIRSLDCQNRKMNRDLLKALKSDTYPEISFYVINIEVATDSQDSRQARELWVTGNLELAGKSREISFLVSGYLDEKSRLRGEGHVDLLMTAFDVKPPTALFGLIKARDEITIRFNLVAEKVPG